MDDRYKDSLWSTVILPQIKKMQQGAQNKAANVQNYGAMQDAYSQGHRGPVQPMNTPPQPGSPAAGGNGISPQAGSLANMNNLKTQYAQGGPTRPPLEDQSRLPASNPLLGDKPQAPPNEWKNALLNFARAIDTPARRENGVYISGAQAFRNNMGNKASVQQENKTEKTLKKAFGEDAAKAILATGKWEDIGEYVKLAVQQPKGFEGVDSRGHRLMWKNGKPFGIDPKTGQVSPARLASGLPEDDPRKVDAEEYANDAAVRTTEEALDHITEQGDDLWSQWTGTGTSFGYFIKENFAPGSSERQVAAAIETLGAQEISESLQQLRKQGKDGSSGLGQITQKELDLLRSLRVNLSTFQNKDELVAKLQELRGRKIYLEKLAKIVRANPNITGAQLRNAGFGSFKQWVKDNYKEYGGSGSNKGGSVGDVQYKVK